MNEPAPLAIVILAAGLSRRMAEVNKLTVPVYGKPLLTHSIAACVGAECGKVTVVTGHEKEVIASLIGAYDAEIVHNKDYEQGIGSSIALATKHLRARCDSIMFALGDTPFITSDMVLEIAQSHLSRPNHKELITRPSYGGQVGHPVIWGSCHFDALSKLAGDVGGAKLITDKVLNLVAFHAPDPARDFDTKDDFNALESL